MIYRTLLFCLFLFFSSSCATIMHGPTQTVVFGSNPLGATISIDGKEIGETPKTILLRRMGREKGEPKTKQGYFVEITLDGYLPYKNTINRAMDGWFLGNILIGGLVGIIVDASTGSMYRLNPEQLFAEMNGSTEVIDEGKQIIYFAVTLKPDPMWEKIGELQKVE